MANPLAEQTITESLTETVQEPSVSKLGFVPKFKAGNFVRPTINMDDKQMEDSSPPAAENTSAEKPVENTGEKTAYKPRFNMKNIPPKPPEE